MTGRAGVNTETALETVIVSVIPSGPTVIAANESENGTMILESGIGRRGMDIIRARMMIIGRRGSTRGRAREIGRGREIGIGILGGILGGIIGIGTRRERGMRGIGRGGRRRVSIIGSMLLRGTIRGGGRGIRWFLRMRGWRRGRRRFVLLSPNFRLNFYAF